MKLLGNTLVVAQVSNRIVSGVDIHESWVCY